MDFYGMVMKRWPGSPNESDKRDELDKLSEARDPELRARCQKYGISVRAYFAMLAEQGSVCAICRRPDLDLQVDHSHKTDRVRALLCGGCNSALGFLQDDPLRARAAAAYLEHHLAQELVV